MPRQRPTRTSRSVKAYKASTPKRTNTPRRTNIRRNKCIRSTRAKSRSTTAQNCFCFRNEEHQEENAIILYRNPNFPLNDTNSKLILAELKKPSFWLTGLESSPATLQLDAADIITIPMSSKKNTDDRFGIHKPNSMSLDENKVNQIFDDNEAEVLLRIVNESIPASDFSSKTTGSGKTKNTTMASSELEYPTNTSEKNTMKNQAESKKCLSTGSGTDSLTNTATLVNQNLNSGWCESHTMPPINPKCKIKLANLWKEYLISMQKKNAD